jgi:glycosyltransferase involved in cell wall biosynthesis
MHKAESKSLSQLPQTITIASKDSDIKLRPRISIVIPVHNEEENIAFSLTRINHVLNSVLPDYEILLVNDGSNDNTLALIHQQQNNDPHLRVISYSLNKGKGHAIKTGVLRSSGKVIVFLDGDRDVSPLTLRDYIKELETCDLVIASKRHPLSIVNAPISRKFLSRGFNLLVRIMLGIKIKDTQSGLKAGDGDALRRIFKSVAVKRYAFDVELLAIANAFDLKIKEMPIDITLNSRFKISEITKMFIDVIAVFYRYRIKRTYQKRRESHTEIL